MLDNVQSNLNYYRTLTGSPQVTERFVNQPELQNASVLQAINLRDRGKRRGTHPHPLELSQARRHGQRFFYNSAVYASHNIISTYGYRSAIRGFFSESTFIYTAGHRTALLSPYIGSVQMGLGDTTYGRCRETTSASESFTEKFAAYPAPGYFPKQDHAVLSDWDIYLNLDYFKKADDNVTAVITDLDTGEAFDYSAEKNNIRTGSVIFLDAPERDETHYYSHSYKVEVFGIKSKSGRTGKNRIHREFLRQIRKRGFPVESVHFSGGAKSTVFMGAKTKDEAVRKVTPLLPSILWTTLESGSTVRTK